MGRSQASGDSAKPSVLKQLKNAGISGIALVIPIVVTVLVLIFVWNFIASLINPFSTTIADAVGLNSEAERYVLLGLTTLGLAVGLIVVGLIANKTSRTGLEDAFDHAISSIPGVGAVYSTFNDMSQMLLDSDSQSFQEVVLVEYPAEGSYSVAFLTSDTPAFVRETVGKDEMITVFMPMGPNPFMGGFILHLSSERVFDVDMTVEEGIQSIVTSGAAIGEAGATGAATTDDAGSGAVDGGSGYEAIREEQAQGDPAEGPEVDGDPTDGTQGNGESAAGTQADGGSAEGSEARE